MAILKMFDLFYLSLTTRRFLYYDLRQIQDINIIYFPQNQYKLSMYL